MKQKQKRFDASEFTNRQIEMRARTVLNDRARQGEHPNISSKKGQLEVEMQVQARLYKEEKSLQKQQRVLERQAKSAEAKAQAEARRQRDFAWGEEHKGDTDAELIAYVRSCADALGRTPYAKEVLGGEYIRSRFISWSIVLQEADIPFTADMKPPTKKMIQAYQERKNQPEKL